MLAVLALNLWARLFFCKTINKHIIEVATEWGDAWCCVGSEFIGLAEWVEEMLECAPGSEGRCGGKQSVVKPFHAQFRTFTVCLCAYYATILSSLSPLHVHFQLDLCARCVGDW